tara:strand:+ start:422 stop:790 length:369 start_codon:yes stop_codon:yes gene_type:complete
MNQMSDQKQTLAKFEDAEDKRCWFEFQSDEKHTTRNNNLCETCGGNWFKATTAHLAGMFGCENETLWECSCCHMLTKRQTRTSKKQKESDEMFNFLAERESEGMDFSESLDLWCKKIWDEKN